MTVCQPENSCFRLLQPSLGYPHSGFEQHSLSSAEGCTKTHTNCHTTTKWHTYATLFAFHLLLKSQLAQRCLIPA